MWIILSLITALFYALTGVWSKHIMKKINRYTVTWAMFSFALPLLIIPLLINGIPEITKGFYWGTLGSLSINMIAFTLFIKALQISPLSLTYPFLAFSPVFLIFTGFVFLGEMPNIWGISGIILTTAGAYVLNLGGAGGFFAPVRAVVREKGSLIMLGVSFMWSFAATFDKVALLESSPYFFLFTFNAGFLIFYIPFLKKVNPRYKKEVKKYFMPLLILGTFAGASVLFQMIALQTAYVSYVIAIKRSGMIITLIFGWIFFSEEVDRYRILGTLMMVAGVVLIAFLN